MDVKRFFRDWIKVGVVFGALAYAISFGFTKLFPNGIVKGTASFFNGLFTANLNFAVVNLDVNLNQQVQTATTPLNSFLANLAKPVFDTFNGTIPSTWYVAGIFAMISGIIIAVSGRALFEFTSQFFTRGIKNKFFTAERAKKWTIITSLFFGMLAWSLLLTFGAWTAGGISFILSTSIVYALYAGLVGFAVYKVYDWFKGKILTMPY